MNMRRWELIRRRDLTPEEEAELARLQELTLAAVEAKFPRTERSARQNGRCYCCKEKASSLAWYGPFVGRKNVKLCSTCIESYRRKFKYHGLGTVFPLPTPSLIAAHSTSRKPPI